jgi:hypothetical protein
MHVKCFASFMITNIFEKVLHSTKVADIRHSSYSVQMLADDISAGTEMCG